MNDRLIPAPEVMKRLGLTSPVTLWRWERTGKIPPPVRIGPRKYWQASAVDAVIRGTRPEAAARTTA